MKNFANFTIGFMFLYHLIKHIFVIKETPGQFIKNKIVWFLVAGILIQASWFLIGALLDVSMIATSAVAAFPGQFIQDDKQTQLTFKKEFIKIKNTEFIFNKDNGGDNLTIKKWTIDKDQPEKEQQKDFDKFIDTITPRSDQLAGPLIFLWASIFKFHENISPSKVLLTWRESLFSSAVINIFMLALFTVAMILIFIINVVRVVTLWLFIALSPILILFTILEKTGTSGSMSEDLGIPEWLKFGSVVSLIFKPVLYTAALSLILIIMTNVYKIMGVWWEKWSVGINGVVVEGSTMSAWELWSIEVSGIQNSFSNIIVFLFALFLCRYLVKMSAQGNKLTEGILTKLTGYVETWISQLPIIPIGWWISAKWLSKSIENQRAYIREKTGMDLLGGEFDIKGRNAFQKRIDEKMWLGTIWMETDTRKMNQLLRDSTTLYENGTKRNAFFDESRDIIGGLNTPITVNDPNWSPLLKKLINGQADSGQKVLFGNTGITIKKMKNDESVGDYLERSENIQTKKLIYAHILNKSVTELGTEYTKNANTRRFGKD